MVEALVTEGLGQLQAEQAVREALAEETESEKAARAEAEAAAERRQAYAEQQAFMQRSPMGLPGMGAKVRSKKG